MINRRPPTPPSDMLENWERWPLVFLFAANALNIFILYVPIDEMPLIIAWILPWVKVACGVAAALSLDGTIISVTMGRRLGRTSGWGWATIVATGIFTAAVAWYVHRSVGLAAAILFMAQAVILVLYCQHLAQPRKPLHPVAGTASDLNRGAAEGYQISEIPTPAHTPALIGDSQARLFPCKYCNQPVNLAMSGQHGRNVKLYGRCVAG